MVTLVLVMKARIHETNSQIRSIQTEGLATGQKAYEISKSLNFGKDFTQDF